MPITPNSTANVSVTKGVAGGYFLVAPFGTTLPTDYSTALDAAFVNVGYISDSGVTHSKSSSNTDFYDLNGDAVESAMGEISRTVTAKLIEINEDAMKEAKGQGNVTNNAGDLSYTEDNDAMTMRSIVEELVLKNGRKFRRVIPCAKVTEWGDEVDVSTELAGYELTYTKYADSSGKFEYGYIQKVS